MYCINSVGASCGQAAEFAVCLSFPFLFSSPNQVPCIGIYQRIFVMLTARISFVIGFTVAPIFQLRSGVLLYVLSSNVECLQSPKVVPYIPEY